MFFIFFRWWAYVIAEDYSFFPLPFNEFVQRTQDFLIIKENSIQGDLQFVFIQLRKEEVEIKIYPQNEVLLLLYRMFHGNPNNSIVGSDEIQRTNLLAGNDNKQDLIISIIFIWRSLRIEQMSQALPFFILKCWQDFICLKEMIVLQALIVLQ